MGNGHSDTDRRIRRRKRRNIGWSSQGNYVRGIHDPQVISLSLKDTAMILWLRGSHPWEHGPAPVGTAGGEWCAKEQSFICRSSSLPIAHITPESSPPHPVHGKTVFHETGPWCQRGWGLLLQFILPSYRPERRINLEACRRVRV